MPGLPRSACVMRHALLCSVGLSFEKIAAFTKNLESTPQFLLARNVATTSDPLEVCLNRQVVQETVHVFQHTVPVEGKPVTNQKNSGKGNSLQAPDLSDRLFLDGS